MKFYLCLAATLLCLTGSTEAQAPVTVAILKGQITDPSGAAIPGAAVSVGVGNTAGARTASSDEQGNWAIPGLPAGQYTLRIVSAGFAPFEQRIALSAGKTQSVDVKLNLNVEKQQVTVQEQETSVNTDPANNVGALVLKGEDLEALSDDPDDLANDLQALAGPSAGPNGGQIFIDGFSGGQLPPKASIREIRVNQNPFSAEYDRLGFGRIEIFTKPGTDKFRGQVMFMAGDSIFNARNPYSPTKGDFSSKMFSGNLSGPVSKRSSFFVDFERRQVDDSELVNATILDPSFNVTKFAQSYTSPSTRLSLSPRLDYQLNTNNTLVGRYTWSHNTHDDQGIGNYSLASRAYSTAGDSHMVQLTETAVLGPRAVNETRFQFIRQSNDTTGDDSIPAISVLDAFTGGGAQVGKAYVNEDHYEIANNTSMALGRNTLKFGGRVRYANTNDSSPTNFGGTFTFGGSVGPLLDANLNPTGAVGQISSIERYRRTQILLGQNIPLDVIESQYGGGPTQFSIAAGIPLIGLGQTDVGVYAQDDFKWKPNLTLSYGLRYETQTNISDRRDFAPRIGVAWAPGGAKNKQAKTVIRAGGGMFYDRFDDSYSLQALRFNGVNQQQYIVPNPNFFCGTAACLKEHLPLPPSAQAKSQTIRVVDGGLRAPYILQTALGIERQLPRNTTLSVTWTHSRGVHELRTRNINAPDQTGTRPYGNIGNLYLYESSGVLNQNQLIVNMNTRFSRRVSMFGFYTLNNAKGNTDNANSFPANQYDLTGEYSRTTFDVRHRVFLVGSITAPWNVRLSPFFTASSGRPFNITSGFDNNGDSLFTDRPAFATDLTKPGVVISRFGNFDPNPGPGAVIIPRNYGNAPGQVTVNMRVSRTWGFGEKASANAFPMSGGGPDGGPGGGGPRGGGGGGMRGGGGPGGGGMRGGFGGGGGGGMRGMMDGGGSTGKRFNVTLSASAHNLLNHVNPGTPVGNVTSALFGQSTQLGGGFGPGGGAAANRRIDLQLRFQF